MTSGPIYYARGSYVRSQMLRPAGQADMTFSIAEANPGLDTTSTTPDMSQPPAASPPSGGMSPGTETALFNTIGSVLNTTGATIASIVQSNNQAQIAQLQAQTQQEIAALVSQSQTAQQQGNFALAQQNAQRAAQLQAFQAQYLLTQRPQNTGLYIVAGLLVSGLIGGIIYAVWRKR